MDIDKERFGGFLARLRREKNLTQRELAERLFVSDKAVSKWGAGPEPARRGGCCCPWRTVWA